jgi:hypothetical protein
VAKPAAISRRFHFLLIIRRRQWCDMPTLADFVANAFEIAAPLALLLSIVGK